MQSIPQAAGTAAEKQQSGVIGAPYDKSLEHSNTNNQTNMNEEDNKLMREQL